MSGISVRVKVKMPRTCLPQVLKGIYEPLQPMHALLVIFT